MPVSGTETREEALYLASQKDLDDKARGLDRENPSKMHIWYKNVVRWFYKFCYDPLATCFRFVHLAVLFGPVILTLPIVLVGPRVASSMTKAYSVIEDEPTSAGAVKDRVGAIWWFRYLTWTMEMAGPSFIKVIYDDTFYFMSWLHHLSFVFCLGSIHYRHLS